MRSKRTAQFYGLRITPALLKAINQACREKQCSASDFARAALSKAVGYQEPRVEV